MPGLRTFLLHFFSWWHIEAMQRNNITWQRFPKPGKTRAKQHLISGLYLRNQHLHLAFYSIIIIFYSFLHVLLSPKEGTTAGLFILISILKEGGDWA